MAESKEEANFKSFLTTSKPCGLEMKFLHATAPRSPIDMYTADACVATEKQPLERRNCGIGWKLDYVRAEGASGTFGFNRSDSDEESDTETTEMDIDGEGTDSQELLEMDENPQLWG